MDFINAYGTTQVLAHGQSEYVREFGMAVTPDPIVVKARVIAPPVLLYGPGSKEPTIVGLFHNLILEIQLTITLERPGNGQWNMFGFNLLLTSSSHCSILGVTKSFSNPRQSSPGSSLYTRVKADSGKLQLTQWQRHSVGLPKALVGLYLIPVVEDFSNCLLLAQA